jgi:chaperonin GroEL
MSKTLYQEKDVRDQIIKAVEKVSLPVIETIGPRGKNVLYESDKGNFELTNDGITIIRGIQLDDPIEHAVVDIIKDGSLRTNAEAGDGTSTTVLYSHALIKKAMELRDSGMSQYDIKETFGDVLNKLLSRLEKNKKEVKSDKTKLEVATISAGGDVEIAKNVLTTITTAGLNGMVYLELNPNAETRLEKQEGFRIGEGMKFQNLYSDVARPTMAYKEIPVIIFDKTLYYAEEAEHILQVGMDLGFKEMCIVAKDFLGDAPNTFIANHARGTMGLVLAKLSDDLALEDLAVYLGTSVISESSGRRVDSISRDDFVRAASVSADPQKILFTNQHNSPELKERIAYLKEELDKDKNDSKVKARLASLTNGIVTLKIGGATEREAREKVYRYEDAVNAVRASMLFGYLIGGGLSMYNAYDASDYKDNEIADSVAHMLAEASVRQIAKNAQHKVIPSKLTKTIGYNAATDEYENLLESGVVEPFKAVEMALRNAVAVATILTSIGTFVLNTPEEDNKDKK